MPPYKTSGLEEASAYQRVRLWSGITSIGFNLCLIVFFAVTSVWWASLLNSPTWDLIFLGVLAIGISMANFPLDWLSGFAIESAFRNTKQSFSGWFRDWVIGRGVACFGLYIGFLLFWWNHSTGGLFVFPILGLASVVLIGGILAIPTGFKAPPHSSESCFEDALRQELHRLVDKARDIRWFENGEARFVNGFISPSGILCLSTSVSRELTRREASLLAAREEWFRSSRVFFVEGTIVVLWSLLGLLLALLVPASSGLQAATCGAAVVTIWCFLALFIWPSLNRKWMADADQYLLKLAPRDEVLALLKKIQSLNKTDVSLSTAKTTVFHPIPPLEERIRAL